MTPDYTGSGASIELNHCISRPYLVILFTPSAVCYLQAVCPKIIVLSVAHTHKCFLMTGSTRLPQPKQSFCVFFLLQECRKRPKNHILKKVYASSLFLGDAGGK